MFPQSGTKWMPVGSMRHVFAGLAPMCHASASARWSVP